ncbi:MAG: hypothetical protein KY476_04720 [Planctomycetes bacterium]|nr:hypothetical protein [Planctomycetota bacterium]
MLRILCLCGKTIGHGVCRFLLERPHELRCVVNEGERPGEWYRTPRELSIEELPLADAAAWQPDLIVVAFYDRILPESLFALPPLGAWNLHLGDAERYRGAYPNIWALANGDTEYAVTLHRIDAGIDTGPILAKRRFPLPPDMTGRELYDKMTEEGLRLFAECFEELVSGRALVAAQPQSNAAARTHYRRELTHELAVSDELKNRVRALTFPPFPPPYFHIGRRKFAIVEAPD